MCSSKNILSLAAGPLNCVLSGSSAMFPTSLVSESIRPEWYAYAKQEV